jgi:hypothetical protein
VMRPFNVSDSPRLNSCVKRYVNFASILKRLRNESQVEKTRILRSDFLDLKPFQLDGDSPLEKFDGYDEKFLFVIGLDHNTFDTLERTIGDKRRFSDSGILILLNIHF